MARSAVFRVLVIATAVIAVAHLLDPWAWAHLRVPEVYERDWGRLLRVVGYLPAWLVLALALWLHTRDRRRATWLALTPALGGLLAEVLKLLLRRERPNLHDGGYAFRPFSDQLFSSKALGLPSSHALVAFAGTFLLCRLYPRATPVWLALGVGCGLSRVFAGAHFISDIAVAGVAGYVLAEVVWRGMLRAGGRATV